MERRPCSTSTAPTCRSPRSTSRSTTRSSARPRRRPSCRGRISAPALSAANACARCNTTGGARQPIRAAAGDLRSRALFRGALAAAAQQPASSSRRPRRWRSRPSTACCAATPTASSSLARHLPAYLNYPFLWEHKAVNAKNWRALERDGLEKSFPQYAAQVALYQAYLDVTNPALFTALNADTCERLHLLVPFDAERAQAWSDRAVNIIEATRAGELLPRFTDDDGDWRCKMCSHRGRCWGRK